MSLQTSMTRLGSELVQKHYTNVQSYMADFPKDVQEALIILREVILRIAPEAEELINYNIPAYTLVPGGKRDHQIMIAGYKHHVGLYPHPSTIAYFEASLKPYKSGKGSVQFPLEDPLPLDLIEAMIVYRKDLITKENL